MTTRNKLQTPLDIVADSAADDFLSRLNKIDQQKATKFNNATEAFSCISKNLLSLTPIEVISQDARVSNLAQKYLSPTWFSLTKLNMGDFNVRRDSERVDDGTNLKITYDYKIDNADYILYEVMLGCELTDAAGGIYRYSEYYENIEDGYPSDYRTANPGLTAERMSLISYTTPGTVLTAYTDAAGFAIQTRSVDGTFHGAVNDSSFCLKPDFFVGMNYDSARRQMSRIRETPLSVGDNTKSQEDAYSSLMSHFRQALQAEADMYGANIEKLFETDRPVKNIPLRKFGRSTWGAVKQRIKKK